MDAPGHLSDIAGQARRRRRKRIRNAVLVGLVTGAYTLGALAERIDVEDPNDLVPMPVEALILGLVMTLGSLPVSWSILARAVIPVPTFLLYLTVFLGKPQPLPFPAAFILAIAYSAGLATLAAYLAERPRRSWLGARPSAHPPSSA
jgi:peptidoglycan/LPS O-acetylase OafA/YrhL